MILPSFFNRFRKFNFFAILSIRIRIFMTYKFMAIITLPKIWGFLYMVLELKSSKKYKYRLEKGLEDKLTKVMFYCKYFNFSHCRQQMALHGAIPGTSCGLKSNSLIPKQVPRAHSNAFAIQMDNLKNYPVRMSFNLSGAAQVEPTGPGLSVITVRRRLCWAY